MANLTLAELPSPPHGRIYWPWTEKSQGLPEYMPDGRNWPRISIVTPSYNQASFLEQTIRSVLLQGYPNLEYVVVDGGSQDVSPDIIQRYQRWLAGWVSEKDRGQSHAINKGWAGLSGDIIAYLNSDDFYFPEALARVALAWCYDPAIAMITGGVAFTDVAANILSSRKPQLDGETPIDLSLMDPGRWFLPQQASFFVTSHLDAVGRFLREDLHFTMDRELMYRLCRNGRVVLLEDCLAGDREHQDSKRLSQTIEMYREDATALQYCQWGTRKDSRIRKRVARKRLAQGYYLTGRRQKNRLDAVRCLLFAALYNPDYLKQYGFLKTIQRLIGM